MYLCENTQKNVTDSNECLQFGGVYAILIGEEEGKKKHLQENRWLLWKPNVALGEWMGDIIVLW